MTLPNIKELRELLKLLRSQGVTRYNTPELELSLNENFQSMNRKSQSAIEEAEETLSPEEEAERILFYSATPPPEESSESEN